MDILDFDKLNDQVSICNSIAANVTDDTEYNAVTQQSNVDSLVEAQEDVGKILSNGNDINDKLDFDDLASAVNDALGINESVDAEDKEPEMKTEETQPVVEGVVDSAEKFQSADPIKQTDFVEEKTGSKESKEMETANTNSEHKVTEHKSDDAVEKQAEGTMKDMQKGADGNKEWEENSKTQEKAEPKAVLKENADKYVAFVESLRDNDNGKLIDGVLKAFDVVINASK